MGSSKCGWLMGTLSVKSMLEQEPFAGDKIIHVEYWRHEQFVTFSNQNILPWIRLRSHHTYILVVSSGSRILLGEDIVFCFLKLQ